MLQWFQKTKSSYFALTTPSQPGPYATVIEREHYRKHVLLSICLIAGSLLSIPTLLQYCFPIGPGTLMACVFQSIVYISVWLNRCGWLKRATYLYLVSYIAIVSWGLCTIPPQFSLFFLWHWFFLSTPALIAGFFLPFWSPLVIAIVEGVIVTWIFLVKDQKVLLAHSVFPDTLSFVSTDFLSSVYILICTLALTGAVYSFSVEKAVRQADRTIELEMAHMQLAEAYAQLEQLAISDPLTGLLNHRSLNDRLAQEVEQARSREQPLGLIFMDLDHFKRVNDTWGHQAGDTILNHIAHLLRQNLRPTDLIARYGGEEFIIVVPGSTQSEATELAERLRCVVATSPATLADEQAIPLTISIGVAAFPLHASSVDTLISAADQAMYQAKTSGRNRVCTVSLSSPACREASLFSDLTRGN